MIPGYRPLLENAPPVTIDYAAEKAASEARRRAKIAPAMESAARVLAAELEAALQAGKGGRPRKDGTPVRRTPSGKIPKNNPRKCTDGSQPGCLGTLPHGSNGTICQPCRSARPCATCGKPLGKAKGTKHNYCYRISSARTVDVPTSVTALRPARQGTVPRITTAKRKSA